MKILTKEKKPNGRRHIYFLGIKILSYKKSPKHRKNMNAKYRFSLSEWIVFYARRYWGRIAYVDKIKQNQNARILVILHLFYPQAWPMIEKYLKNLSPYNYDLVVTMPTELYNSEVMKKVLKFKHTRYVQTYVNRGFDIGPFCDVLNETNLNKYDIILKLHSKGIFRPFIFIYNQIFKNKDWFFDLYNGILDGINVHKTVDILFNQKRIGLVAAENLIVEDPAHKQALTQAKAKELSFKLSNPYKFVAGSCFAIKSKLLTPIKNLQLSIYDFDKTKRGVFSLAHAIERLVCDVEIQGYQFYGNIVHRKKYAKKLKEYLSKSALRLLKDPRFKLNDEFFLKSLEGRLIDDYTIHPIKIKEIKRQWNRRYYNLTECSPYHYLLGDKARYNNYCEINLKKYGFDMSLERFEALCQSLEEGYDPRQMPVIFGKDCRLMDGQHRLCWLLYKYGPDYEVTVLHINPEK